MDLKKVLDLAIKEKDAGRKTDRQIWNFIRHQAFLNYETNDDSTLQHIGSATDEAVRIIEGRMKGEISKGLDTGFPLLNKVIGYWQNDTIYYIGARPGVGKTALQIALTDNMFLYNDNPNIAIGILQWNFEAANYQTAMRFISRDTKSSYHKLMSTNQTLSQEDFNKVLRSREKLKSRYIYMVEVPVKPEAMIEKAILFANKFKEEHKGKEIYLFNEIDHTLLSLKNKGQSNTDLVESVSKATILIKKETHMSSIVLSQLKDESVKEDRRKEQYRPRGSDLAWSQMLEQDAETIILLHSPIKLA